jgi:hypothetical protein
MVLECNHNSQELTMKEFFGAIGTILGIMVLLFVLELVLEPAQAQVHADLFLNTIAHIYHSAQAAFH